MKWVPGPVVDRLPSRLWATGNLHVRGNLHFCHDIAWVRTVEWSGRVVAFGTRPRPEDVGASDAL